MRDWVFDGRSGCAMCGSVLQVGLLFRFILSREIYDPWKAWRNADLQTWKRNMPSCLVLISDLDKLTWLKVLACGNQQCHR